MSAALVVGGVDEGIATTHGAATRSAHGTAVHGGGRSLDARTAYGIPQRAHAAYLLRLRVPSTETAFARARVTSGRSASRAAARQHFAAVKAAQHRVIAALPRRTSVLYKTHAVMAAVAVRTSANIGPQLRRVPGVQTVYPIIPKVPSLSYAVPLQRAPQAWEAHGNAGGGTTIAIIDSGVDYTHADFGGLGAKAEYDAAKAQLGQPTVGGEFPGTKVAGGYDLAGDDYDPDGTDDQATPQPDAYPLDCGGHGTHVAGIAAGYGVNANGSTYDGSYTTSTPFASMRIGPGIAPEATLYAYRVFGCEGSTDLASEAIDKAMDPNGDGDPSDHVDVINMSLGSAYGRPDDGDSVATNLASKAGITMVVAGGNDGDEYGVGGSPGSARRAIAVANAEDGQSKVDALHITAPAGMTGSYDAYRAFAYPWGTMPDLAGNLVPLAQSSNLDGCDALNAADAAAVSGHIAFMEWAHEDAVRRCGSATRADNVEAAGATGYVLDDDEEFFTGGITGNETLPGALVNQSAGDAIRTELEAGHTVTTDGTVTNGPRTQLDASYNDRLDSDSSRGINDVGNVKPDVGAVGSTVFSAGVGTGNDGLDMTGTSMASPMVAGEAALLRTAHGAWTPAQIKADIMNTASQDIYDDVNHTGHKYGPNRVGAGRINVEDAVNNEVLASVVGDPGAVSVSFGPVAVTKARTLTRRIQVQNTSNTTASYDVSYRSRTSLPGASYSISPRTVTVAGHSSRTVTVRLSLHPGKLTKHIDPTMDLTQEGYPRQYQADVSGIVRFVGSGVPNLRVPVYAAPRPAATMTQQGALFLKGKGHRHTALKLSGGSLNQGKGRERIRSLVAGFELAARSGKSPRCPKHRSTGCVSIGADREVDLAKVGVTSDAPQWRAAGKSARQRGAAYFAFEVQRSWLSPMGWDEFDVYMDTNHDGKADVVMYNSALDGWDIPVTYLEDLKSGDTLDTELVNSTFGDVDTAFFNSDALVMPVAIGALPGITKKHSRISYAVYTYTGSQSGPIDSVGRVKNNLKMSHALSFDPLHPGVTVAGRFKGKGNPLLWPDRHGSHLRIQQDVHSFGKDDGLGALFLHFHNRDGDRAQDAVFATPTKLPHKKN
jgi:subtilisin family serine protease